MAYTPEHTRIICLQTEIFLNRIKKLNLRTVKAYKCYFYSIRDVLVFFLIQKKTIPAQLDIKTKATQYLSYDIIFNFVFSVVIEVQNGSHFLPPGSAFIRMRPDPINAPVT
jgi:hypothetical protein